MSEGYDGLPPYYIQSSDPLTPNLGLSLKAMDPIIAENFVLIDDFAAGGGGSSVLVNGATITNPNFNGITPAAPGGSTNVTWQVSGSDVSAYIASAPGAVLLAPSTDQTIIGAHQLIMSDAASGLWIKGVPKSGGLSVGLGPPGNDGFEDYTLCVRSQYTDSTYSSHMGILQLHDANTAAGNYFGHYLRISTSGTNNFGANLLYGLYVAVNHLGSGPMGTIKGADINGDANSSGAIGTMVGVKSGAGNFGTGNVDSIFGFTLDTGAFNASQTVSNNYSIYVNPPHTTGIITHNYGLYIADQTTGGANNPDSWAIYIAGGRSLLGTLVDIGATDTGISRISAAALALGNGTSGDFTGTLKLTILNAVTGYQVNGAASSGNYLRGNGTNFISSTIQAGDLPAGTGTVTSVALATGAGASDVLYTITGSPITTSGTITETLRTQTANIVLAGPTTGVAASPTFRALVTADMPVGTGTVTSVTFTGDGIVLSSTPSSAVTTTGTLTAALANAAGGTILGRNATTSGAPSYTIAPVLGIPGTSSGTIALASSTASGKFIIATPASSATPTLTLPTTSNVLAGQFAGDGVILSSTLAVASSAGTVTASLANAAAGTVLNNATASSAAPTYTAAMVLGVSGTIGTVSLKGNTSGTALITPQAAAGTPTLTLPNASGTFAVSATSPIVLNATTGNLTFTASGAITWDQIGNAAGALTLANGTNATTFNQTSAVNWIWANTTAATSGVSQSSPIKNINGTYWTGAASATDGWSIQNVVGTGTNGSSVLTIGHSGSAGSSANPLQVLISVASITNGNTKNPMLAVGSSTAGLHGTASSIGFVMGGNNAMWFNMGSVGSQLPAAGVHGWSSSAAQGAASNDTGLSRISGGTIGIGTGAAASIAGSLQLNTITSYGGSTTVGQGVPSEIGTVVDSTAQSAAIAATNIIASAPRSGMYRISMSATITTAASTSSVLGGTNGFQVGFTSPTDSVAKTTVAGNSITTAANTTGTAIADTITVYAKTGTAITYAFDYSSVGVTAMIFEIHVRLETL